MENFKNAPRYKCILLVHNVNAKHLGIGIEDNLWNGALLVQLAYYCILVALAGMLDIRIN